MESIGERFKKLRKSVNITQVDFAKLINISQASLSDIEKGINRPSVDTIIKTSSLLGVSTDWLLKGEIKSYNNPIGQEVFRLLVNFIYNNVVKISENIDKTNEEVMEYFKQYLFTRFEGGYIPIEEKEILVNIKTLSNKDKNFILQYIQQKKENPHSS